MMASYRGEYLTVHGGGIDGMISQVAALPDQDFGVVVLTNSDEWGNLADAIAYEAIDRFLGVEERSWAYEGNEDARDWSEVWLAFTKKQAARVQANKAKATATRIEGTSPSRSLEAYAGTYRDDFLGDVEVTLENGSLVLRLPRHEDLRAPLEHWHLDIFHADWDEPAARESLVEFDIGTAGKVRSVSFQIRPDVLDPLTHTLERVAEEE